MVDALNITSCFEPRLEAESPQLLRIAAIRPRGFPPPLPKAAPRTHVLFRMHFGYPRAFRKKKEFGKDVGAGCTALARWRRSAFPRNRGARFRSKRARAPRVRSQRPCPSKYVRAKVRITSQVFRLYFEPQNLQPNGTVGTDAYFSYIWFLTFSSSSKSCRSVILRKRGT